MISINNGAILVKTGRYDGLMQVGMLDDNREGMRNTFISYKFNS